MEWVPVNSRMLSAVAYNSDWKQLYLEFRSGEIYCYGDVPASGIRDCSRLIPKASTFGATF